MQSHENTAALPLWIIPAFGALGYCLTMQPFNQYGTPELVMATVLIVIGMCAYLLRHAVLPRDEREQHLQLVALRWSLVVTCVAWLPIALLFSASLATAWALMVILWAMHIAWFLFARRQS